MVLGIKRGLSAACSGFGAFYGSVAFGGVVAFCAVLACIAASFLRLARMRFLRESYTGVEPRVLAVTVAIYEAITAAGRQWYAPDISMTRKAPVRGARTVPEKSPAMQSTMNAPVCVAAAMEK